MEKNCRTVGIIAAMQNELELLKENISGAKEIASASGGCWTGTIGDHTVAAVLCGIGKVSAALAAQELIDRVHPDCIINTGCAGALADGIGIGEIVLSTVVSEWDLDMMVLGAPRGYIDRLGTADVKADSALAERIGACVPDGVEVHHGRIVSGDQFISTDEQRNTILSAFPDALCAEMEGAAIGHVCAQNGIPFCIIRAMSDTADHGSTVDFSTFSEEAGKLCNHILMSFLQE